MTTSSASRTRRPAAASALYTPARWPGAARLLQTGLGRGIPGLAQQGGGAGTLQHPGGLLRQQAGLVIAPLPQAPALRGAQVTQSGPSVQLVPDALGHELAEGAGIAPAAGEFVGGRPPHRAPVGQGETHTPKKFPRAPGESPLQPRQRPLTIRAEQGVPLRQEPAAEGTAGREQEVEARCPSSRNISPFRSGLPRGTAAGDHALMIIRIGKRRK